MAHSLEAVTPAPVIPAVRFTVDKIDVPPNDRYTNASAFPPKSGVGNILFNNVRKDMNSEPPGTSSQIQSTKYHQNWAESNSEQPSIALFLIDPKSGPSALLNIYRTFDLSHKKYDPDEISVAAEGVAHSLASAVVCTIEYSTKNLLQ